MQFLKMCFTAREGFLLTASQKSRDYLFDNCKVLLILLVVIGHFIEPSYQNSEFLSVLKWFIFSFHMPAFIFISGYFSKRELSAGELIRKLAIPYLVYESIYYLFYTLIIHKPTNLSLHLPKFSLWYLLALLVWRFATPYVKKIPHHIILSVAAGLLIGCSDMKSNFFSIPRILVYYPFFLAGIHCSRDMITSIRTQTNRIIAAFGTVVFLAFLIFTDGYRNLSVKIFYGRYNYDYLDQTMMSGILCRIICYGISAFMTFALLVLMTERKTFYSYIGGRTMAIYLFHGLTYSYLKDCTDLLNNIETIPQVLLLLISCVLLTQILSVRCLTSFTDHVASVTLARPSINFTDSYGFIHRLLMYPKA